MTHGREGRPEQTHRAWRRWLVRVAGAAVTLTVAQWTHAAVAVPGEEYLGDPESDASDRRRAAPRDDAGARGIITATPPRKFRLPPPTDDERDDEQPADGQPRPTVYRVGFGRSFEDHRVAVPDQADLRWRSTAGGGQVATFELLSPGAAALRAQLVFQSAPAGTEVRVYDPDAPATTTEVVPLTAEWREELATDGSATVWTPTVVGDSLAVEFYLPRGARKGDLRFSVPNVSHLDEHPMRADGIGRSRCWNQVDAACRTDMVSSVARRAVAKYLFTDSWGRSSACTGTLVNDLDAATQVPYFLTAQHCVGFQREASTMEFYWFFERTACGDSAVRTVRTAGGATLLASEEASFTAVGTDFALLRLNRPPPRGVGLAGWTDATVSVGDRLVSVHHPALDLKKVGTGTVVGFEGWRLKEIATHIRVRQWEPTEGGSSGSGAWTRVDGQDLLVGVLTGGPPSCYNQVDSYGRLDRFYPQVRRWLGGAGTQDAAETSPVTGLVLLDAATGATVANLTYGDATVDLGHVGTASFNIRADTAGVIPDSVRLDLTGAQTAARSSLELPFTLYGPGGGSGLAPGSYEVTASPYESDGTALAARTAAFTVTGRTAGDAMAVSGLTLLNAAGHAVGAIADGGELTAPPPRTVAIVARTVGDAVVGRVEFAVSGAATLSHTAVKAPFRMRAEVPAGTYRIVATPYAPEDAGGAAGTALTVEDFTLAYEVSPVTGFTLVDARGGAPDPDRGPIEDGATVDLSAAGGLASIRAELAPGATVGSVRLAITGPRAIARVENTDDHAISLFGDDGRDYQPGWLPDGTYTVVATPYRRQDARRPALVAHAVTFTVTGSPAAHPPPVTGFTLVDARGGAPDPDLGPIGDGDTVDVGPAEGQVTIRADAVSDERVGSVKLELTGPVAVTRVENSPAPFALFGDDLAGDYHTHWLPNGAYTLTATPYSGRDARGDALPGLTVAFTVTGGLAADAPVVTGFTLVDARGGPPDPDLGPIVDGASVDIGPAEGQVNIRADVVSGELVGSALLVLTGPVSVRRVERGPAPFALFGDDLVGDYQAGWLPNGAYTLTVWPFSGRNARGYVLPERTVSFTVTGGPSADASPVTGFTLVDARGAAPNPDLAPIVDGGTVDVSAVGGEVSIRADVANDEQFRSVRLELFGPVSASRLEQAPAPFALFGNDRAGGYYARVLLNGAYRLRATPYVSRFGPYGGGPELPALEVSFTVIGGIDPGGSPVTGFTLVDARGGAPDPDLGPIEDGGTVDIGPADGQVSIRVDLAHSTGIASVRLELTGPVSVTRGERTDSLPVSLYGDDGRGDYNAGWLADGAYTLTATPSKEYWWIGHAFPGRTVSFTVTGSDASASKVTGLMLVDARGGPPDPDIGLIGDGATLDLSDVGGRVNVRAEMAAAADVGSVRFDLRGPYSRSRTQNAGGLYTLFGDKDGDYHERELLDGPYTLTATPYSRSGARGDVLRPLTVAFTVTGGRAADATPVTGFTLVDARGGAPDPDLGPIGDGATVDVSAVGGEVSIRADVVNAEQVRSMRLELTGPVSVSRLEDGPAPYALFGDDGAGDYRAARLVSGAYRLTATPYSASGGGGEALRALEVSFTLAGGIDPGESPVAGFTLVDARGGAPDADLGPITDGATVDVSGIGGEASIRADVENPDLVGSMRLELSGPVSTSRLENAPAPFALFGDDLAGDYYAGRLVAGSYRVKATPYSDPDAGGALLAAHEVAFTVTDARVEPAITGFTLIDARDAAAATVLGPVADGGAVDVSRAAGRVDIRADVTGSAGSVRLVLSGPRSLLRLTDTPPFSLFGSDESGHHRAGWLTDGAYTLTATVFAGRQGSGAELATRTVAFTVSGGVAAGQASFTLVDARGGPPDPDIGPVPDGATLDLSAVGGVASIRADLPAWPPSGSARFTLSGPRYERRVVNGGSPYALFGDLSAGDYRAARLPNGGYTLTVRPYAGADASGESLPATTVRFTVAGARDRDVSVTGFTRVDPRGGAPDADVGPLADGATVDLSSTQGSFNVRAEVSATSGVGSVRFALSGPVTLARVENAGGPYSLFGDVLGADGRRDYRDRVLPNGVYTLTASTHEEADGAGDEMFEYEVSFTVAGSIEPGESLVSGFTLVDARDAAPDPDLGPIADGATVDVGPADGQVSIRADLWSPAAAGSVRLELSGPVSATRVENTDSLPLALFGDDGGGDYTVGWLPDGAYALTATPYAEPEARGDALPARTVTFTVTGFDASASKVTGLMLVDARDAAPDPDLGLIEAGATLNLSGVGGRVNVRAEMAASAEGVGSVHLELRGPHSRARTENADGPYTLFGENAGDYVEGELFAGSYTLTATPYPERDRGGRAQRPRSVAFTVTDGRIPPVSGFTLVDARGGAPDPDLGPIVDGGTVSVRRAAGQVSIRADLAYTTGIRGVRLELTGPVTVTRVESTDGLPLSLFGDNGRGRDYAVGWLPNGAYTITATPYGEPDAGGDALPARTVSFTVTGFDASESPVTGFTLVDARGGAPDPDLGPIEDGAVLDLSGVGGRVSVRAQMAAAADVGSVHFELRGPYSRSRTENAGGPYTLFGDEAGDYYERELFDGAYTLTATPYGRRDAEGSPLRPRSLAFTVTGGRPADASPVTGFTLVDARGGAPDPDLGPIADGAAVDITALGGRVGIRADVVNPELVGSMRLQLTGPVSAWRLENAPAPFALFGDDGEGDYRAGSLPAGAYRLMATPYRGRDGVGGALRAHEVSFTSTQFLPTATVVAAAAQVSEGAAASFTVTLDRAPARPLPVAVTVSATGNVLSGVPPRTVTFAAGQTRATFAVATDDDAVVEAASTVTATLSVAAGYAVGNPAAAATEVVDDDVATFAAQFDKAAVAEGDSAVLTVSISNGATFAADQEIVLTTSGAAERADYVLSPTTLTLPAGRTSATATLLAVADDYAEAAETVTATARHDGAAVASATTSIGASDAPVVHIAPAADAVREGSPATFTVTLEPAPHADRAVAVTVSETGDALSGVPPSTVTFASGETRATLHVATDDDAMVEDDSLVTATLEPGTGYTVGEPSSATVTVSDDDAAVFAVTAVPELIEEGGSATVAVSITNGVILAEDTTVSLSVSGMDADEYRLAPATSVLAAGATSVTATFTALADDAEEAPETARIAATVDGAEVGAAELTVEDAGTGPRITGVPQVGGVLEAVLDDTVADPATAWQWLRDGAPIAGGTQARYAAVEADVGAALSVRVQARGREGTSSATMPVWPAPSNPPLAADEEELLGTTLTLGSRTFGTGVGGFSRLPGREFGSVDDAAFAVGDRELTLFMVNKWGNLGLATEPVLPDADGLTAYWDGYPIGSLKAREVDDRPVWMGRTPQPPEEFERYVTGASDGVRVAVSLRRPLPAATLSALSGTVPEGSAATFEVALDRAAWSARTVSLTVLQDGAVLAEAAPVAVAFAAGESRATVTLGTVDDAVIEGDGAVTVTLVAGDGYVLGEETSASVTVEEDDEAVFAVSAAAEELDEGGATTLTVAIANGKTFAADQSIALAVSGSASASDYRLAPATLALAVGETSAAATLTAVRDVVAEPAETVTVTATHDGSALGSATVTIAANEAVVSTATVSALSSPVTEGTAAEFEVRLDAATLATLSVSVTVSETASMLSGAAPPAVTFAVGESRKTVSLATADDTVVEAGSDVTLSILPGGGYTAGAASSAAVTVLDDDAASFEVSASPEEIDEGGSATLTVSIANGVTFAEAQSIALSVAGSASAADYGLAPETLALAAGATSVTATLTAVDDADEESAETATVTATHGGTAVGSATLTIRARDIPSDDASLASLVLSDVDIGPFSLEVTDYVAQVPSELSSTTVTATANDAGAVVEIADAVGSTLGETRTVHLEEGDNEINVTVAAEDGATTRTYHVAVARAYAAAWGEPLPERDIDLGAGAGPTGLWSDGETLWVIWDWRLGTVRAYDLDDGSLLAERRFELTGGSGFPSGLWSDGTTLWVSDFYGGVTAHRLSDGARLPAEDLDGDILSAAGNSGPSGLWSDGATLWVADDRSWKAFAYRLSDKSRLASKEVSFLGNSDPVSPWGLWSDGETLLVADPRRGMLHSYRLSDGAWQEERTVNLSTVGISIPMGLWSDGRVLWVAGERETTVHAYAVPGLRRAAAGTFPVRVSSRAPRVPGAAQGGRSVGIPDAALRGRIAAALGKPADAALGERELAALTALDARAAGVTDLTGLEYAVHLTALDLGDNALVDLRVLADLPALTVLNLDRTGADPWSLARLTGLRRLSLRGNGLGDVQALRSLTALRVLDIGANRVEDLTPLGGLSALEALRADGNAVDDASALRAMGLRILDLDGDAAAERSP